MAFYPRAAIIKRAHEWDGQAIEFQITMSPILPINWEASWLDGIANALFTYVGDVTNAPNPGGWGASIDDMTPLTVNQRSCEIYLMQGGFTSAFFRKVFPINSFGQRALSGDIMPSFVAAGFSSATTEYQKKPSDFRFGPLGEADVALQEIVPATITALQPIVSALNSVFEIDADVVNPDGTTTNYISEWVTSVVTRLKIEDPDNPGVFDYVLPSQPGDPVFATRVTNWALNNNVTSQISRKRRKNNA